MTSSGNVSYRPREDASPERERAALAAAFRILFSDVEEEKAAGSDSGHDAMKGVKIDRAENILPP
jgi:hypothetical protein